MDHLRIKDLKLKEGKGIAIVPIGDCQSERLLYKLDGLVKWALREWDKGNQVYFFGCGDYKEATSPTERVKIFGGDLHSPTYEDINKLYIAKSDDFISRLKPVKDHCWLFLTGHHMAPIMVNKGQGTIPSDQYIAEKLGARYSGDGMVTIYTTINGVHEFKIMAHHGYGGARTGGAALNKRLRMREVCLDANVYCLGHDNQKVVKEEKPLRITPEGVVDYKQYFIGIGCIQESYEMGVGQSAFAERLLMAPAAIGFTSINLELEKNRAGKWELDWHVRV